MSAPLATPEDLFARRVVVCLGAGGVGKTTVSAAIALAAARRGQRALVLTIDPARRLADALGVGSLGHEPQALPREILQRLGVEPPGAMSAMMLDMKRTFDELVLRFAPDTSTRERIFANPIYQHVSDALAGSAEYSAMEKVYEVSGLGAYDLVVLDTPPSAHALDFLEAPERMLAFLDSKLVQLLLHPAFRAGRFGLRLFQRGAHQAFRVIERVTGVGFLEDISEFLLAFEGMAEGFRERARRVQELLYGPEAAFVLAAGPTSESVRHAGSFLDRLVARQAPVAGVVVNRLHAWPAGGGAVPSPDERSEALASLSKAFAHDDPDVALPDAAEAALWILERTAALVARDERAIEPLVARAAEKGYFLRRVPEFSRDVHDLEGLARVAEHVFAPRDAQEAKPRAASPGREDP